MVDQHKTMTEVAVEVATQVKDKAVGAVQEALDTAFGKK
jgi:hypothetical protein